MSDSKEKKKPGRPRKTPLKKALKRNGISLTPLKTSNVMEFIYDIPINFKKIFQLFISLAARHICMEFREKTIDIIACCHLKKTWVKITIDCAKVNHYYCAKPTKVFLNPGTTEKIIKNLNREYTTISWILNRDTDRSSIDIIFKNLIEIDEHRVVNLIQSPDYSCDIKFSDEKYPIKFSLTGKYFKQLIAVSKTFSNQITIKKTGNSPLIFTYSSRDKSATHSHIVRNEKNINLVSTLEDDDIFSASVNIDYIEPLSKSIITNAVKISADNFKDVLFETHLDNKTISIFMSTKIVTLRDE